MEINVDRRQMWKAVSTLKNFAERPSGLKALQHVVMSAGFGRARLTATDLSLWCQIEVDARTPRPGTVAVPVRGFEKVLKTMPQSRVALHRELDGDEGYKVVFASNSSEVRMAGFDPREFPEIDAPAMGRLASIPVTAPLVRQVAYAVSRDETRYTLGGVYFEIGARTLKLVGTDGHRLAHHETALPAGSAVETSERVSGILPVRLLTEGVRLNSTVTLEVYEKVAAVRAGSVLLWADLMEGQYPDYETAIPSEFGGSVAASRSALAAACCRLLALGSGLRVVPIRVQVNEDGARLSMKNAAEDIVAVECVKATVEGVIPPVVFNGRYLSDALEQLSGVMQVRLKFSPGLVVVEGLTGCAGVYALVAPEKD